MTDNFKDEEEKRLWDLILWSEWNPYIVDDFVRKRTAQRSMQNERTK